MRTPKRIQRKRTKGWRMPEGAVYVGRPSRWGNPFKVGPAVYYQQRHGSGAGITRSNRDATSFFRRWIYGEIWEAEVREYGERGFPAFHMAPNPPPGDEIRAALAGRDLACWCPLDQPCHADVLLELANRSAS